MRRRSSCDVFQAKCLPASVINNAFTTHQRRALGCDWDLLHGAGWRARYWVGVPYHGVFLLFLGVIEDLARSTTNCSGCILNGLDDGFIPEYPLLLIGDTDAIESEKDISPLQWI